VVGVFVGQACGEDAGVDGFGESDVKHGKGGERGEGERGRGGEGRGKRG
jgi:hypothetical protein